MLYIAAPGYAAGSPSLRVDGNGALLLLVAAQVLGCTPSTALSSAAGPPAARSARRDQLRWSPKEFACHSLWPVLVVVLRPPP